MTSINVVETSSDDSRANSPSCTLKYDKFEMDKPPGSVIRFCQWKKILVRSVHIILVLGVTGSLFILDTKLREALVLRNYSYVISFVTLTYASLMFYFLTCLVDPGYVELNDLDNKNPVSNIKLRFCDYCHVEQPIRSRHCEECKRCIRKFDHHCPWLETCIGERNHKYFWFFLGTTNALTVWCAVITIESFEHFKLWSDWIRYNLFFLFDMQVIVVAFVTSLSLFIIHTYFMLNNTTTWEKFSRRNITYLRIIKNDKYNPFAQGYLRNIYLFLCSPKSTKWEVVYATFIRNKHKHLIEEDVNSSSSNEVEIKMDDLIQANRAAQK